MITLIKYCLISVICFSILLPVNTFAVDNPSEPYLFMKDMIEVTSQIVSSAARIGTTREENINETNEVYVTTKMMKDFRTAIYDIEQAKIYISKYKNSKNEPISKSTESMLNALNLLNKNYEDTIKYFEVLYSKESLESPNAGKMMSNLSKLMADRDEILKMCALASIMSTYALVSDQPDKDGHLSYLTITSQERNNLKKKLEDYFGENIKDGLKAGQSLPFTPASALYEFIKKNDFTPADKKTLENRSNKR